MKKSRITFVLLGVLFGTLGVHNFYIGRIGAGIGQLIATLILCWFIFPMALIGLWVMLELLLITETKHGDFTEYI